MSEPPRARVELSSSETVAERGITRVTWRVRHGDGWIGAAEHPGAVLERVDAGPGTVWETRIAIELPVGATVMRVESRPARYPARGVMDYLSRETRLPPRRVKRTLFRVGKRGQLVAVTGPAQRGSS